MFFFLNFYKIFSCFFENFFDEVLVNFLKFCWENL